jgi:hypothetical protein
MRASGLRGLSRVVLGLAPVLAVLALPLAGPAAASTAPATRALHVASPKLLTTDRHVGTVHVPHPGTALAANQSNNWSGYNQGALEKGTPFTSISGQWVVPTATQHTKGQAESSATWLGIGGGCVDANCTVPDETLIQTGTEQDVAADGSTSYDAWFELIPAPELIVTNVAIHPGDTVKASITAAVPEVWTITLTDVTDGQGFTQTAPYPSTLSTAEWIEETPLEIGTDAGLAALPNLGSVNFDLATTNGAPAGLTASEEMQLIDSNGNVIMAPSAPDGDKDGFNDCAWATTCSAPTSS